MFEGEQLAARALDEQSLIGAKQLLCDDGGVQGVASIASSVVNHMGVTKV